MNTTANVETLARELDSPDAEVRLSAIARVVASVNENPEAPLAPLALDALLRSLGAERKAVARRAVDALARMAQYDARIVARLRDALGSEDRRTRWGAAYTLGMVDGALDLRALPSLLEALSSDDGDIRWAAAELVVRMGRANHDLVVSALIAAARDGDLNPRKMALYCLRDLAVGGDEILDLAENCCAESHILIKLAALSLISRLSEPGDRAASLVRRLLEADPDAGVRRSAAVALGHIGNRSDAVFAALRKAAVSDDDLFLKRSAQRALERLGAGDDDGAGRDGRVPGGDGRVR